MVFLLILSFIISLDVKNGKWFNGIIKNMQGHAMACPYIQSGTMRRVMPWHDPTFHPFLSYTAYVYGIFSSPVPGNSSLSATSQILRSISGK